MEFETFRFDMVKGFDKISLKLQACVNFMFLICSTKIKSLIIWHFVLVLCQPEVTC